MKKAVGFFRAAILIMLGVYIVSLSIFLIVSCFKLCFYNGVIRVYEYISMVAFIIADVIVYILLFRYFMFQRVYDVRLTGRENIVLITQFRDVSIRKSQIIKKSVSYLKSYKIKVMSDKKVKTFFVPYKLMDKCVSMRNL